jgi:hypothetical protein
MLGYQLASHHITSHHIKSNQIKSNQIKSNQIKSNQIKSMRQLHQWHLFWTMPADWCLEYSVWWLLIDVQTMKIHKIGRHYIRSTENITPSKPCGQCLNELSPKLTSNTLYTHAYIHTFIHTYISANKQINK